VLSYKSETPILMSDETVPPITVRQLVENGCKINVEQRPVRIFDDKDCENAGATYATITRSEEVTV